MDIILNKNNVGVAFLVGALASVIVFLMIVMTSPRYKAQMDFLVVQNTETTDFYALFKSSEFLGELFSDAVHTESFIDQSIAVQSSIGDVLPIDKRKRLNTWKKMVLVSTDNKLGRLQVVVLHDDIIVVQNISLAITRVLIDNNVSFRGGAENSVIVKLLTGPVLEDNPSVGKIIVIVMLAFLAGSIGTISIIYFRTFGLTSIISQEVCNGGSMSGTNDSEDDKDWDESFGAVAQKLHDLNSHSDK